MLIWPFSCTDDEALSFFSLRAFTVVFFVLLVPLLYLACCDCNSCFCVSGIHIRYSFAYFVLFLTSCGSFLLFLTLFLFWLSLISSSIRFSHNHSHSRLHNYVTAILLGSFRYSISPKHYSYFPPQENQISMCVMTVSQALLRSDLMSQVLTVVTVSPTFAALFLFLLL